MRDALTLQGACSANDFLPFVWQHRASCSQPVIDKVTCGAGAVVVSSGSLAQSAMFGKRHCWVGARSTQKVAVAAIGMVLLFTPERCKL